MVFTRSQKGRESCVGLIVFGYFKLSFSKPQPHYHSANLKQERTGDQTLTRAPVQLCLNRSINALVQLRGFCLKICLFN